MEMVQIYNGKENHLAMDVGSAGSKWNIWGERKNGCFSYLFNGQISYEVFGFGQFIMWTCLC